jgi:DNA-binding CsgD family transcriptional regulator
VGSVVPAVVVARKDGALVSQNAPARRMMGEKLGSFCWNVVGKLEQAEGLSCRPDCVARLLSRGPDRTRRTNVRLVGRRYQLTCVPVDDVVVCLLNRDAEQDPKKWQLLTSRECDVLSLLAAGLETAAVAEKLAVSESTVRSHVENMRSKLGVGTRAALVALGFRLGYLS